MDDLQELVQGNTAFSLDLYRRLSGQDGNLFFSPYSISVALAMTYAGARGLTETEMGGALHFTLRQEDLHPAFKALKETMDSVQGEHITLRDANALWPHIDYHFSEEFISLLQAHYRSSLTQLNYREPEPARQAINAWVAEKTAGCIRDLIAEGVLNSLTRLVLSNAIYFKGAWAEPFDEEFTATELFWVTPERDIPVPTMKITADFGYAQTDQLQILELLYDGKKLSMLILLPVELDGLAQLEAAWDTKSMAEWLPTKRLYKTEVELSLPKFKLECKFQLNNVLRSLGIKDAFNPKKANFSGMDPANQLYISQVIHQAFVDVTEEGTEAAAATAVMLTFGSMPTDPVVFRANHPFLFVIRENSTGSILFMGRVQNPIG